MPRTRQPKSSAHRGLRLRILGESVISAGGFEVTPTQPHLFALLLRLSVDAGLYFQRGELARLLHPNAPSEGAALHSLRELVYRASSKGVPICKRDGGISLDAASVSCDLEDAILVDQGSTGSACRVMTVLPGYSPDVSEEFREWAEAFRERQQSRLCHSLLSAIERLRRRGDWPAVEARARECLLLDTLNEPATLALAEALARTGSKGRAIATLDAYRAEVGALDPLVAVPAAVLRKRIESSTPSRASIEAKIPFVGRGDALAATHDQWRHARAGEMQFTIVRGEPGAGKSRFLEEFRASVDLGGATTVSVRQLSPERYRPFALFAELVPQLLQLSGAAARNPALSSFLNRLTSAAPDTHESPTTPGEAEFVNAGIRRAIANLIDAICHERPCVIFIDDSRAIDDISLALLQELLDPASPLRLQFIIVQDIHDTRRAMSAIESRIVNLGPLTDGDSLGVVRAYANAIDVRLGDDAEEWCVRIGAGNPTFLLLLVAHCAMPASRLDVPSDIVSAVDRRLASLAPLTARVLEACAVLGDHCETMLLDEVIGLPPFELANALHELEHGGLIASDGDRVLMRSSLMRERTILSGSASVLGLLHSRSALALEKHAGDAQPWVIASHWRDAGYHQRARATLTASWRKSLDLGQPSLAEASIREYLSKTIAPAERVALYDGLIEVTQAAGAHRSTVLAIDERIELMRSSSLIDEMRDSLLCDRLNSCVMESPDPAPSTKALTAFMKSTHLDASRRARAAHRLLVIADSRADRVLATDVHDELLMLECRDPIARSYYDQSRLIFHSVFGNKDTAVAIAESLIHEAKQHAGSWPHVRGIANAALAFQLVGDPRNSSEHLEDCYARVVTTGVLPNCVLFASRLAVCALDDGNIPGAMKWVRSAEDHAAKGTLGSMPCDFFSVRADLAMLSGDFAAARVIIEAMKRSVPFHDTPRFTMGHLAYSLRLARFECSPISQSDVARLLEWHREARSYGRHDDEVDALWGALEQAGKKGAASKLLHDYLTKYRRETRSPRYMLRLRTQRDPSWATAGTAIDSSC